MLKSSKSVKIKYPKSYNFYNNFLIWRVIFTWKKVSKKEKVFFKTIYILVSKGYVNEILCKLLRSIIDVIKISILIELMQLASECTNEITKKNNVLNSELSGNYSWPGFERDFTTFSSNVACSRQRWLLITGFLYAFWR